MNLVKFKKIFNLQSSFQQPFVLIVGQNPKINDMIYNKNKLKNFDVTNYYKMIMPLPSSIMTDSDFITVISRATYMNQDYVDQYKKDPQIKCFKITVNVNLIGRFDPSFVGNGYKFQEPIPIPEVFPAAPQKFFQILRDDNIQEKDILINNYSIDSILKIYKDVAKKLQRKTVPVKVFSVSLDNPEFIIDTGLTCIQKRYDCFFDNRDTVYFVSTPIFTQDAPNGIFVFGVNHVNTKKAIYTNINIYDGESFTPIFDLLLSEEAQPFYVKNGIMIKNYKYFYEIMIPYDFYRIYKKIFIAERAYLQSIISSSFNSLIFPEINILPYSKNEFNKRYKC
jgi:hypothetical protein